MKLKKVANKVVDILLQIYVHQQDDAMMQNKEGVNLAIKYSTRFENYLNLGAQTRLNELMNGRIHFGEFVKQVQPQVVCRPFNL